MNFDTPSQKNKSCAVTVTYGQVSEVSRASEVSDSWLLLFEIYKTAPAFIAFMLSTVSTSLGQLRRNFEQGIWSTRDFVLQVD
jgi:hypothetical protein